MGTFRCNLLLAALVAYAQTAPDYFAIKTIADVAVSPDGKIALFTAAMMPPTIQAARIRPGVWTCCATLAVTEPRPKGAVRALTAVPLSGPFATIDPMTREEAWDLLCEFTKSESLRRHALAVETCVAAYARKFGEDEAKWSLTALLHDFDWEVHPEAPDHPMKGEPILAERGVDAEVRRAILSHANYSGVPRESMLEKTLFACDELAGFLTACSYVKPNRSIFEVDTKSVRKKLKDKAFARSVSRDDITNGAEALGVDLDRHIEFCIEAMQERAVELGVAGTVSLNG